MAQGQRNYDEMSREELVEIIGGDVDPDMSRADLITMARERDRRNQEM